MNQSACCSPQIWTKNSMPMFSNIASLYRSSVGNELPYQEVGITKIKPPPGLALSRLSSQTRTTHPPEVIIDRITKQLIMDVICTRDGETRNRSTISPQNTYAAYPNRAVQDISNWYRELIAVSGLIQMRGYYTHRLPFHVPQTFHPITSRLVQDAVLCRCGHTYDRASIERWILQHRSCPINEHPLHEEDLYPNQAMQRLIVGRVRRTIWIFLYTVIISWASVNKQRLDIESNSG